MLDIKLLRSDPDRVKAAMKTRNADLDAAIDEILDLDRKRRDVMRAVEDKKAEQNADTKKIPVMKKNGEDTTALMARLKELSDEIKECGAELGGMEETQRNLLLSIPNIPNPEIPVGKDDAANREVRRWGEPTAFPFTPKAHWDIGTDLGILDFDTAAKVSGARFTFYRGLGSRLERAIINFFLNTHVENGYDEVYPPYMVTRATMTGTGQLPKFEDDAYKVDKDTFLIPTAEVPVTNMYREMILDGAQLPIRHCAYSTCFRAEAGSAGRDTRGLIRQHQFNKV